MSSAAVGNMEKSFSDLSRRVLVLATAEGDSEAIVHVLRDSGYVAHACADMAEIVNELSRQDFSGAGAFIVAQEALRQGDGEGNHRLAQIIADQPGWSDLPVILLAARAGGEDVAWEIARRLDPVGNITILERPLRRTTLVNAVVVALRARARQYELRATLLELAQHRERLQELVDKKTAELAASTAGLVAAERLASLGTLAAGLGHDIGNLALPIRTRLDSLRDICKTPEARSDLDGIQQALTHLSNLSAGMRLMALDPGRAESSGSATDLGTWAMETIPMLRASLPRHVCLECHIASGLGVRVSRHRLAQAVFNLVQNAGEAMVGQSSGLVRIVAEASEGAGGESLVTLRVSDNGPGMSAGVLARCFEPYFSTKGRAISTGMGLGLVKGIVEASGGRIHVESIRGAGTTFSLFLPAAVSASDSMHETNGLKSAALSLSTPRMGNLANMFLKHLGARSVIYQGSDFPPDFLWVLDTPNPRRIRNYLHADLRNRVVLLADQGIEDSTASDIREFVAERRIIALRAFPAPSQLRDALATCLAAREAIRSGI